MSNEFPCGYDLSVADSQWGQGGKRARSKMIRTSGSEIKGAKSGGGNCPGRILSSEKVDLGSPGLKELESQKDQVVGGLELFICHAQNEFDCLREEGMCNVLS